MLKRQMEILEQSFNFFSKELFDSRLSDQNTIITIQTKGKANAYGWCSVDNIWYNGNDDSIVTIREINICAEYLNRPFYNTCETLLHEMCHLDNLLSEINDCSRKQFHNELFKSKAESIGLNVNKIKNYGWSETRLGELLKCLVDKFITDNNIDTRIFNIARKDVKIKRVTKSNKKIKMICKECGVTISCDDEIGVICKKCGNEFIRK